MIDLDDQQVIAFAPYPLTITILLPTLLYASVQNHDVLTSRRQSNKLCNI